MPSHQDLASRTSERQSAKQSSLAHHESSLADSGNQLISTSVNRIMPSFNTIPPEVRLQIYDYVLWESSPGPFLLLRRTQPTFPALVRTNKKMYHEFKDFFWSQAELELYIGEKGYDQISGLGLITACSRYMLSSHFTERLLRNTNVKEVKIRIGLLSLRDYEVRDQQHATRPMLSTAQLDELECFPSTGFCQDIRRILCCLRSAKQIRNLNIGLDECNTCGLDSSQVFNRFIEALASMGTIANAEMVEIMPFWSRDYFTLHTEDTGRAMDTKRRMGDKGKLQGFVLRSDDPTFLHYDSWNHRDCEQVYNSEKRPHYGREFILQPCPDEDILPVED